MSHLAGPYDSSCVKTNTNEIFIKLMSENFILLVYSFQTYRISEIILKFKEVRLETHIRSYQHVLPFQMTKFVFLHPCPVTLLPMTLALR